MDPVEGYKKVNKVKRDIEKAGNRKKGDNFWKGRNCFMEIIKKFNSEKRIWKITLFVQILKR